MMSVALSSIPSDPIELRAFAVALQAQFVSQEAELRREIAVRDDELYANTLHIAKLKAELILLRRARFGRSSEKLDQKIEQMELHIDELEEAQAGSVERREAAAAPSERRERAPPSRQPLPEHLPRETIEHDAACVCPNCGGRNLTKIGTDEREVLEYVPSHFKVIVHSRPKMSCRNCETIMQQPMPSLPIERGRPGPGLLAHVLVSKYCDHLPVHRQSVMYARDGVEIDRSTLAEWVGKMRFLLEPLAERIFLPASRSVSGVTSPTGGLLARFLSGWV